MTPIKNYIGDQFLNKTYHFVCDCIIPLDVIGVVKDYEIIGHEIVLTVLTNEKLIHIGLNTSSLQIKALD
jgi:hypothetical protein